MSSLQIRRIASHLLLTKQGFYKRPLLTVNCATKQIISVEQYGDNLDSLEGVEFYSGILCNGFVNAHCHIELSYLKGAIQEGVGYAGFAGAMAAVRGNFTDQERQRAIAEADDAMWREGVDAVADIVNDDSSFAVKSRSKIDYHSFAEVFGLKKSNLELCKHLAANPQTTLSPHSTYSVQSSDFDYVCKNGTAPLSIHFMESEGEYLLYKGEGPLAEWYKSAQFECDFLRHNSPAKRIVNSIPATRSVILVHNSFVSEEDIDIIMNHFSAPVYWVLCPRSNRYISGSIPQTVELLRAKKLNICIGTDSLASNHFLSILEEIKALKDIPLFERLNWATNVGAAALSVDNRGIINIDGVNLSTMQLTENSRAKRVL